MDHLFSFDDRGWNEFGRVDRSALAKDGCAAADTLQRGKVGSRKNSGLPLRPARPIDQHGRRQRKNRVERGRIGRRHKAIQVEATWRTQDIVEGQSALRLKHRRALPNR
ncbi:hypothetical protein NKI41_30030 [Mesorhizobium sp. M0601]|uniref:hypothetical protein n=1 Tax=unclassified Mesorhizobium TaxID=325217 RepID=UPI0033391AF6